MIIIRTLLQQTGLSARARSQEFLNQLGTFECQIFGFATPSLTGEEIFAHRTLLNVDDVTLTSPRLGEEVQA